MTEKKKPYATIANPTIEAVVNTLYRFSTLEEALERLAQLQGHFVSSTKQLENTAQPTLHLWIKGFGVVPEDKAKGVIGHFAIIAVEQRAERWTLTATKLDTPAQNHPQRAQVKRDNPNWGHPVIRGIRKGKAYKTLEEAQSELDLLHTQFPRVSIPNLGKLYIMIYCADRPPKERMVKHILSLKLQQDATYIIECKENLPKEKRPMPKIPEKPSASPSAPQGYFTAKVALKSHTKGKSHNPTKPEAKPEA